MKVKNLLPEVGLRSGRLDRSAAAAAAGSSPDDDDDDEEEEEEGPTGRLWGQPMLKRVGVGRRRRADPFLPIGEK